MITSEDIINNFIYDIQLSEELSNIPLIGSITIDNNLWGRPDIIINRYYNGELELIPHLLNFNNISDISEMKIGMIMELPDFDYFKHKMVINKLTDENIPGVNKSMNNKQLNIEKTNQTKQSKTTASPKLNITLKNIDYNKNTGVITI
jgi:hypothetical protein